MAMTVIQVPMGPAGIGNEKVRTLREYTPFLREANLAWQPSRWELDYFTSAVVLLASLIRLQCLQIFGLSRSSSERQGSLVSRPT